MNGASLKSSKAINLQRSIDIVTEYSVLQVFIYTHGAEKSVYVRLDNMDKEKI